MIPIRRLRPGRSAALSAIAVLVLAVPLLGEFPTAARADHGCGTIHARGYTFHVTVARGRVSCHTARKVLRAFMRGRGRMHGPKDGPAYRQYWTLYGWKCGHGAGGGGCTRDGRRIYAVL
jgi:hypothetical protein